MNTGIGELLGSAGPLAATLPGYSPRPEQQQMAEAIAAAIAGREHLVVEAGTGTGKTFAYLLPALQSGLKVIISTGTRHLQDQLYGKDLPVIREAFRLPARVALLLASPGDGSRGWPQTVPQATSGTGTGARLVRQDSQWRRRRTGRGC
jgi:hypothetical protein